MAVLVTNSDATCYCKTCFFWLRQLRRVRRSLDIESLNTLVHAFVRSRVDYCNSVSSSTKKKVMDRLQHVQNAAARLVTVLVAFYWAHSDDTVHYKSAETANFCGFRCATTSPITVFINFVFYNALLTLIFRAIGDPAFVADNTILCRSLNHFVSKVVHD